MKRPGGDELSFSFLYKFWQAKDPKLAAELVFHPHTADAAKFLPFFCSAKINIY